MADPYLANPQLAELYGASSLHGRDFDFHLRLLMSADSVLGVGCGNGELPHTVR